MRVAAIACVALLSGATAPVARQETPLYKDPSAAVERRVDDLVARMTLEEKVTLLGGTGFATKPIARLGIPEMTMTDGPVGVRWEKSTAFPAGIAMAATWDTELVQAIGAAIGREAKAHGRDILLGPCLNIQRVPHGGRNFESLGEDPWLASRMAVAYVRGVQQEHVVATPKHFAANNQETERNSIDTRVDERTLREIYWPGFLASVKEAGALAVMSAYNKLNGAWCSENPRLLTDLLKREWGFNGVVMSDWGAVHTTVPTANAGCDLEMPRGDWMNEKLLLPAVQRGEVAVGVIDDKVRRILRVMMVSGVFDRQGKPAPGGELDSPAHRTLAREAAIESTVLLKHDPALLPLDPARVKSIAVIGPNAGIARTGGGGSSRVNPFYTVSPLDGIEKRAGGSMKVNYAPGCGMKGDVTAIPSSALKPPVPERDGTKGLRGEYFPNIELSGPPAATRIDEQIDFSWGRQSQTDARGALPPGIPRQNFSARWTGTLVADKTADYDIAVAADDGARVYLGDALLIDAWQGAPRGGKEATTRLEANRAYPLRVEYFQKSGGASVRLSWRLSDSELMRAAVDAARTSDVAVVFAGLSAFYESEGSDRETLSLPENQERLILAVAAANPRTIVVLNSGAPVVMESWIDRVAAIFEAWYPGQEAGNAIAALLFGDRSPSGRLPATFLRRWEDSPAFGRFPGKAGAVDYSEGIFVGYRHFDRANIEPRYPFGHGVTYTSFMYRNPSVTSTTSANDPTIDVSFEIENDGRREGAEVAQIYVHDVESSVERPQKELKAFRRINLKPGQRQRVTVTLDRQALAFYDEKRQGWTVEPGAFEVLVGSSSRLIRFRAPVLVK